MHQADVGVEADTAALLDQLAAQGISRIDVLVSNASCAPRITGLDDYTLRGLQQSIRYGAWPLVDYLCRIHQRFGGWPRYAVAMSSTGPDAYTAGYDYVAASKATLETLVRYLSHRLRREDIRINALRSRSVRTASFEATFGEELVPFVRDGLADEAHFIAPRRSRRPPSRCAAGGWTRCGDR